MRHVHGFGFGAALFGLLGFTTGCGSEDGGQAPQNQEPSTGLLAKPDPTEGFQLDLGKLAVESGREFTYCIKIPLPAEHSGKPIYLSRTESVLTKGTHHFFSSFKSGETVGEVEGCFNGDPFSNIGTNGGEQSHGIKGAKLVFGSGEGSYERKLPNGYGRHLTDDIGMFLTDWHIFNTAEDTIELAGAVNIYTMPEEEVVHPVNQLNCLQMGIDVPSRSKSVVTGICTAPFDIDLVVLGSHAHQYLTRFESRIFDGTKVLDEPIYVSDDWDSPAIVMLDQPIRLKQGQGIHFSCHYTNDAAQNITYGFGDFGEMCATMNTYAYPADRPREKPPGLGAILGKEGQTAQLFDTTNIDLPF